MILAIAVPGRYYKWEIFHAYIVQWWLNLFVSFGEIGISVLGDLGLLNLRYKLELYLASKLP